MLYLSLYQLSKNKLYWKIHEGRYHTALFTQKKVKTLIVIPFIKYSTFNTFIILL